MTHRTAKLSSLDAYKHWGGESANDLSDAQAERSTIISRFSYAVMMKVAFPEIDFGNRWCWQNFGPRDGECIDQCSEYTSCDIELPHAHVGSWTSNWFVKTDYNFGFNEWYFSDRSDRDQFLEFVPSMNWGEKF